MSQKRRVTRLEVAMVAGCGDVAMTPAERAELDAKIGAWLWEGQRAGR
jgi:hypothetical protein